jgi:hypothetical protein
VCKSSDSQRWCACRLQLPPLGQLQKLLIGHNNQGQATSWHLSLVEVVEEESGRTSYFAADRCVGRRGTCSCIPYAAPRAAVCEGGQTS